VEELGWPASNPSQGVAAPVTPRTWGGRKNKTSIPNQPNQKKQNINSKSPLLPKLQTPISRTKRDPKKKICNHLHQQPNQKLESAQSEIQQDPAKSGETQPQNSAKLREEERNPTAWRKETVGLQALAIEEERIRESGRERKYEAAKIFNERTEKKRRRRSERKRRENQVL
jgi:hypothetical protein